MLYKRRIVKLLVILNLISLGLIIFHGICVITSRTETISIELINKMKSISWNDKALLKQKGFVEKNELLVYDKFEQWGDNGHASFFCIYVEEMDENDAISDHELKLKDNVLVRFSKSNGYNNIFSEFICKANTSERFYKFYLDGCLISIREHNESGDEKIFEKFLLNF